MDLYNDFKVLLNSGKKVLLLKAGNLCNCASQNILAEHNIHCPKCLGTGKIRTSILTEKIRYGFLDIKKDTNIEKQTYEKIKNSIHVFYFPFNYEHINMSDIIVTLKHNSKNEIMLPLKKETYYKVIDFIEDVYNDFKYLKIVGEKINGVGV